MSKNVKFSQIFILTEECGAVMIMVMSFEGNTCAFSNTKNRQTDRQTDIVILLAEAGGNKKPLK